MRTCLLSNGWLGLRGQTRSISPPKRQQYARTQGKQARCRIADFISENPESELNLSREMIFDENSYFDNESALPIDLRISLGRYLIAPVTNQGKFDICEFARKCPPWIANRDLDSIELSVRAQNVYRMQGFEIVREPWKASFRDSLLSLQNFGRKSIRDTREAFLSALSEGPVGLAEEASNSSNLIGSLVPPLKTS